MRTGRDCNITDRRSLLLNGMTLAGAAAMSPAAARHATAAEPGRVQLAQAGPRAGAASTALAVKSVERLAGSTTSYAYAVKAGPFVFLNGHEAYDFEHGLAPEVEGPPAYRLTGTPPLRREADYILRRMRSILKEFGTDLPYAVRVDQSQHGTGGVGLSPRAFAEFGSASRPAPGSSPSAASLRARTHTSMIAIVPSPSWTIESHARSDLGLRLQSSRGRQRFRLRRRQYRSDQ
jgi:hypothetical protein